MRRKRKTSHIGGGGKRHPASLANLRRGITTAPPGNQRRVTHGFGSQALVKDVGDEVRVLMDALAEGLPVRDPADTAAIEVAAAALRRWRSVSSYCDLHGRIGKDGKISSPADYELRAERALHRCLDDLGMSPLSRSRLGLNIARTQQSFDLARYWQEQDNGGG